MTSCEQRIKKLIEKDVFFESQLLINMIVNQEGVVLACNEYGNFMLTGISNGVSIDHYLQENDRVFMRHLIKEACGKDYIGTVNITLTNAKRESYMKVALKCVSQEDSWISISMLDQTQNKSRMQEIVQLSLRDQLTGLNNRRFFEEEVIRLDKVENYPMGIVYADVNGLKIINDTYGHETGDKMLIEVSNILKKQFQDKGLVCRLGGDEFTLLLPKMSEGVLANELEILKKNLHLVVINEVKLSIAIGSVTKTCSGDIKPLLNEAEESMYQSKLFMTANAHKNVINGIISTLHEKHPREEAHSKRVSLLMEKLAMSMNLSEAEINFFKTAGLLHDIGKIAMDYSVLEKPRALTSEELRLMRKHSEIGYRILVSAGTYHEVVEMVLSHHEKYDGSGYPRGLKGDELTQGSRALMLCDAYDAMTSERPYKSKISQEDAINEIRRCKGSHFDTEIAETFIDMLKTYNNL